MLIDWKVLGASFFKAKWKLFEGTPETNLLDSVKILYKMNRPILLFTIPKNSYFWAGGVETGFLYVACAALELTL